MNIGMLAQAVTFQAGSLSCGEKGMCGGEILDKWKLCEIEVEIFLIK